MVLQRSAKTNQNTQEGTCTSGVSAGKRQGSWDNLQKWKSVGFTCITFGWFRRKQRQSSMLVLNYFVEENKLYI